MITAATHRADLREPQGAPAGDPLEDCVSDTPEPDDAATAALEALVTELDNCIAQLRHAHDRAERLLAHRRAGGAWLEIVTAESRPLVVESISAVMSSLATAGHAWRREQALALQREDVSINRIAALFGVTRQRISALLRDTAASEEDPAR